MEQNSVKLQISDIPPSSIRVFNSLLSLGIPNIADVISIHILSAKLDYGSLKDFVVFLQQRCQAFEMLSRDDRAAPNNTVRSAANISTTSKVLSKSNCLYCNKRLSGT